jgi:hypothetical protein
MQRMDETLWAARMALVALGAVLTYRGIGDAVMWEAVIGAVMAIAGPAWSWLERRRLRGVADGALEQLRKAVEQVGRP